MKKFVAGFLTCLFMFGGVYAAEQFTAQKASYNVIVDGQVVESWGDVPPMNVNGRTMLPLAKTGELLGVNVQWDGKQVIVGEVVPIPTAAPSEPVQEVKTVNKEIVYNQSMMVDGVKVEVSELLEKKTNRTYSIRLTNTSAENKEYFTNKFMANVGNSAEVPGGLRSGTLKPGEITEGLLAFSNSQQITTNRVIIMYMKATNRVIIDD